MEEKKKLLLIINPVAGRAEVRHNLVPVLEIFGSAGYMVTVFVTGKSGDASDIIIKHGKECFLLGAGQKVSVINKPWLLTARWDLVTVPELVGSHRLYWKNHRDEHNCQDDP